MKCRRVILATLGAFIQVSLVDAQASKGAESLCFTFLSTYLAPVADQGSSRISGRPELKPSAEAENPFSTQTQTVDDELTESLQTQSESVVTPASSRDGQTTQDTATPTTTLSDLISTSTRVNEPAGLPVIFLVSLPPTNEKHRRDVHRRAPGGFVGSGTSDVCTFASSFNLDSDQLFDGADPVYYFGEDFKPLIGQGPPPIGATTRAFTADGQTLAFRNSALPRGEAEFCQDPEDGEVYLTFTTGPPGCVPVILTAYRTAQCQNGRLVGVDALSSTTDETDSEATTTIEQQETTEPSMSTSLEVSEDLDFSLTTTESSMESSLTNSFTTDETTSEDSTNETEPTSSITTETTSLETTTTNETTSSEPSTTSEISETNSERTTSEETTSEETTSDETTSETTSEETTSTEMTTTSMSVDACVTGVGGPDGNPPLSNRLDDCEIFNRVTVSPYTVTETSTIQRLAIRIPTGMPTGRPTINTLAARADPDATTIEPSDFPLYASYCDSPSAYYEACSDAGITRETTTLETPTTTVTTSEDACVARRMVKRAGEAMGYEFEGNWDAYNMPGYKLF